MIASDPHEPFAAVARRLNIVSRVIAALERAGITDYVRPFHDGRHSAITNDAAAGNSGLAVMRRAGHSDFRVTQMYLDLAGVEFAEEAERAAARAFAHVPRAKVRATPASIVSSLTTEEAD